MSKRPDPVADQPTHFGLTELTLKLRTKNTPMGTGNPDGGLNSSNGPTTTLRLRVGFVPYRDIRRNFWLTLARTFDSDGSNHLTNVELVTLLDAIGSTYSNDTISSLILAAGEWDEEAQERAISFEGFFRVMEENISATVVGGRAGESGDEHVISILFCPVCGVWFC